MFVREAPKYNVKPVLGIDFRNGVDQQFVAIAKNNDGFQELNELLSYYLHNDIPIPEKAPFFKNAVVIYPFKKATFKLRNH